MGLANTEKVGQYTHNQPTWDSGGIMTSSRAGASTRVVGLDSMTRRGQLLGAGIIF